MEKRSLGMFESSRAWCPEANEVGIARGGGCEMPKCRYAEESDSDGPDRLEAGCPDMERLSAVDE